MYSLCTSGDPCNLLVRWILQGRVCVCVYVCVCGGGGE